MIGQKPRYRFLYLAGFLLAIHYALTIYINSSYLSTFFPISVIDHLYMAGSLLTVGCLILSSRFLKWFGNNALVLVGLLCEIAALLTLAFATNPMYILLAFVAHQCLPPLLIFGMDIFFEGTLTSMKEAEKVRGFYLSIVNLAYVCAPLIAGSLANDGKFSTIYIISSIILSILWFIILIVFHNVRPKRYREVGFQNSLKKFLARRHLSGIFIMNFTLQCFYALMVIYTAPYLHEAIGLSWSSIGFIYTIMLLPFVMFEAPLGKLFERHHDEREILIIGFIIMAFATVSISYVESTNIFLWAFILFMTRVGASFVEVASEASFFKRVTDQDAAFIGVFKLSSPLSYVVAPFIAGWLLMILPVSALYIVIGGILLTGIGIAYRLSF